MREIRLHRSSAGRYVPVEIDSQGVEQPIYSFAPDELWHVANLARQEAVRAGLAKLEKAR